MYIAVVGVYIITIGGYTDTAVVGEVARVKGNLELWVCNENPIKMYKLIPSNSLLSHH